MRSLSRAILAQAVKAQVLWRHSAWLRAEPAVDLGSLLTARNLRSIDGAVVVRKNGYGCVEEYRRVAPRH